MPRVAAPAPAITGDVVRLTAMVLADGQQAQWSIDYMSNMFSASPQGDMSFLLAQWETAFAPGIKAALDAMSTYEGVLGTFLSRADIATQTLTTGSGVGTIAGGHLPLEMAVTFRKNSVLKGAHGRGRLSWGPVSATFVVTGTDANNITGAARTALQVIGTALAAPITIVGGSGATFSPCVSTRPLLGASIVTHAQPVNTVTVDLLLGTVRRRKPGRGI